MDSTSELKIFIVGPRGAGKTVFSSMLNHYVMQPREIGVTYTAGDCATKEYFARIDDSLNRKVKDRVWPPDTAEGKLIKLQWEWRFNGRSARFILVDPPGQDIETVLRGGRDPLGILEGITTSNVLFILTDLHEHQGEAPEKKTQNAWIVENVLKNAGSVHRIVIGISKGDLMTALLPTEFWEDKSRIMALISQMMPEFNLAGYQPQIEASKVQLVMFSAVATEAYLDAQNQLLRRPCLPLQSAGLEVFVKTIMDGHADKEWETFWRKVRIWAVRLAGLLTSKNFWVFVFVFTFMYFVYWIIRTFF